MFLLCYMSFGDLAKAGLFSAGRVAASLALIFFLAYVKAAAAASSASLPGSSWAGAVSSSRALCSRAFFASIALISASVLVFSPATFCRVVSMASRFAVSAQALSSASFCAISWTRVSSNGLTSASF